MMNQDRTRMYWWDKMWSLQRYAFFLGPNGNSVKKVPFSTGNHYACHDVENLVDEMQDEINRLSDELEWIKNGRQ